jgi:hypothetical protein
MSGLQIGKTQLRRPHGKGPDRLVHGASSNLAVERARSTINAQTFSHLFLARYRIPVVANDVTDPPLILNTRIKVLNLEQMG